MNEKVISKPFQRNESKHIKMLEYIPGKCMVDEPGI